MITHPSSHVFTVSRVGDHEWLINDPRHPMDDSRHVVAHVEAFPQHDVVHVTWVRAVSLPTRYIRIEDALEDLARWESAGARSTRPVQIPSFRPPLV